MTNHCGIAQNLNLFQCNKIPPPPQIKPNQPNLEEPITNIYSAGHTYNRYMHSWVLLKYCMPESKKRNHALSDLSHDCVINWLEIITKQYDSDLSNQTCINHKPTPIYNNFNNYKLTPICNNFICYKLTPIYNNFFHYWHDKATKMFLSSECNYLLYK